MTAHGPQARLPAHPCVFAAGALVLLALTPPVRAARGDPATEPTRTLARELLADGLYEQAAVEYRRLSLAATQDTARAGFAWAAARAYGLAGRRAQAALLLDDAEDASPAIEPAARLLRAEFARAGGRGDEAAFYLDGLARSEQPAPVAAFAGRRLAAAHLRGGRPDDARQALDALVADTRLEPGELDAAIASLASYERGRDRSPALGGWLGILPGLGYAYSGEYANATRSLILNALFIYGMVDTADDDDWGAFSVITFFELTWYTGSIYGGVDAAHRHNRDRLTRTVDTIEGSFDERSMTPFVPLLGIHAVF